MIFISIIIPNYNHAPFLKQRIESVLNQSYQKFEVILLDDKSLDNSWEILQSYKSHEKVSHCLRNDTNSGNAFKQWKKGIELAKGDFIWLAESDDFCDLSFLSSVVEALQSTKADVVFCKSMFVDEHNTEKGLQAINLPRGTHEGDLFVKKHMYFDNLLINASAVVFRKSLISHDWDPLKVKFRLSGDWYFWVSILKGKTLFYIDKPLNYYRKHSVSISATSTKLGLWLVEGLKVQAFIEQHFVIDKQDKSALSKVLYKRFFKQLKYLDPDQRDVVFKKIIPKLSFTDRIKAFTLFTYLQFGYKK